MLIVVVVVVSGFVFYHLRMLIIVIIINILRFLMPDIDDYSNKARGVTLTLDKALWPSRVAAAAAAARRETERDGDR